MSSIVPRFSLPRVDHLAEAIRDLPVCGHAIAPRGSYACFACGRKIGPSGRLLAPGCPTCDDRGCELTRVGALSRVARPGPYGAPIRRATLASFCRLYELPSGVVLVQRQPITERAQDLAQGLVDLVRWGQAFDAYERLVDPAGYRQGTVHLLPPRRLDEVRAFRLAAPPAILDPTAGLDEGTRALLRTLYEEGEDAVLARVGERHLARARPAPGS